MGYIELIIIGILLIIAVDYYEKNKENKYWKDYYKEQYFKEKDFNDNYIKNTVVKETCDHDNVLIIWGAARISKCKKCNHTELLNG